MLPALFIPQSRICTLGIRLSIQKNYFRLGYYLLISKKNSKDAIEIFKFNIKIFPKYANGYDSLAEAYMMAENTREAIKNFAKSLELDPDNTNAIEKLNELIKKK